MKSVKKQSHSWWFDSHNSLRSSTWLQSTLQELDEKAKGMLELIEENADSFSQCAELFYKRRPQLVDMVEQLYRAQHSLAEQYDQLRSEVRRHQNPTPFYSLISRSRTSSPWLNSPMDKSCESSSNSFDSDQSEVDDPEEEVQVKSKTTEVADEDSSNDEVKLMHDEIERLKGENEMLKVELKAKDEEKREVIRQLSLPIGILSDENASLRKCIKKIARGVFAN
ncbi:protein NETWORKED 3C [Elaeis guineensis]|uniref:Protein NETWORKED 3A n=1 Tax=Elaeis guineensis var. tenera TaxID=51953 RepID=A0A6I9Q8Q8_ELAGV|nr:protein NETWORKED 3A [Elaeis guineensis]XP_010904752.1 protein NETWORKED 3A [Elaeis guineensis]